MARGQMAWLPLSCTGSPGPGVRREWRTRYHPAFHSFLFQHLTQPSRYPSHHPQDIPEATTPLCSCPRAFSCNQGPEGKIGERIWWFHVWMRRFPSVSCPRQPNRAQGQDTSTLSPSPHTALPSEEEHWCSALRLSPASLPQSLGVEGRAEPPWSDTHQGGCGSEPLGSLLSNMDSEWTPVLMAQAPPEPW